MTTHNALNDVRCWYSTDRGFDTRAGATTTTTTTAGNTHGNVTSVQAGVATTHTAATTNDVNPPLREVATESVPVTVKGANSSKGYVLPGVDAAMRCADPSVGFPATYSEDEPLCDTDPRIVWREHFSEEHQKPYYQNVQTSEVTYIIPDRFKTSFPRYYTRLGYEVDSDGIVRGLPASAHSRDTTGNCAAVDATTSTSPELTAEAAKKTVAVDSSDSSSTSRTTAQKLRVKLATYGAGGLFLYALIHGISFLSLMASLYIFRIDIIGLVRSYGFNLKMLPKGQPDTNECGRPSFWKTFVTAAVINKLSSPVHFMLAIAIAPFFARRLEPVTYRLIRFFKRMKTSFLSKRATVL